MENDQTNPILPSPLLRLFAELLSEMVGPERGSLILNGDFLEMALCPTEQVLMVARLFFEQVGELFSEIIFIPGNHDHHLWEAARESQYLTYLRHLAPAARPQAPWSTTKVFMDFQGKDRLLCGLLTQAAGKDVVMAYPNFGLRGGNGQTALFSHGHFIEPAYHLMSTLMSFIFPDESLPGSVYDLEKENAAWIDFLWSLLGNCGAISRKLDVIFDTASDEKSLQALAANLASSLARADGIPGIGPDWARDLVFRQLLYRYVVKNVVSGDAVTGDTPLSATARAGFEWYFGRLLTRQMAEENAPLADCPTIFFGHTHKPFQCAIDLAGYACQVRVLNTGAWTVDTIHRAPQYGATAALIDDDLNAVNLWLYNEGRYEVRVEEPLPLSALSERIGTLLAKNSSLCRSFSQTVASEVASRAASLQRRARNRESSVISPY
jgi:hypothetical protein